MKHIWQALLFIYGWMQCVTCVDLVLDEADLAGIVIYGWMQCVMCVDLVLGEVDLAGIVIHN